MLIWKKDRNSVYTSVNELCSVVFGYKNPDSMINNTDYDVPCKLSESAEVYRKHDMQVMNSDKELKLLEITCCSNEDWKVFITTKSPIKDEKNCIIGTMGHAVDVTSVFQHMPALIRTITQNTQTNDFPNSFILDSPANNQFSPQQTECIFYLLRGYSIKQIAKSMKLSPRTVEHHIEKIRDKLKCKSKNELSDALIAQGYFNLIPQNVLRKQSSIILQ